MWKPLLPDQEDQAAEVPEPKPLGIGMDHEPDCDSVGPCGGFKGHVVQILLTLRMFSSVIVGCLSSHPIGSQHLPHEFFFSSFQKHVYKKASFPN